jgi:hypothetical protein
MGRFAAMCAVSVLCSVAARPPGEQRSVRSESVYAREIASFEREYPLHGLALHYQVAVFPQPEGRGTQLGYLRRGTRVRAKAGTPGPGCDTLWHELHVGGYACAGRGFQVADSAPSAQDLPTPPVLTAGLPYAYFKVLAKDLPLFTRLPTALELLGLPVLVAAQRAQDKAKLAQRSLAPRLEPKPRGKKNKKPERPAPPQPRLLPDYVRLLMQPGFYVSLDAQRAEERAQGLLRTARGDLLHARDDTLVHESALHGSVLVTAPDLKLGHLALATRAGIPTFTRDAQSGSLTRGASLEALEALAISDEVLTLHGRSLRVAQDGRLIPNDALRVVPHTPRPAFVPPAARYLAISLSTQTLVAYDGPRPIYATLISSGREGFATPTGIYRIQHKHISTTMDGEAGSDESYRIEDVPWTMYFAGSVALHGAFWHERFGQPRSHGCVNLAPKDAQWLFAWASPTLPPGLHGVYATREDPGTFVVITP